MSAGIRILSFVLALFLGAGVARADDNSGQALYKAGSQKPFAGPETYFTGLVQVEMLFPKNEHTQFSGTKDGENVVWKEKVTDAQYQAASMKEEKVMNVDEQLSKKQQAMIPIAAFTATGDLDRLKVAFAEGLDAGLTINEAKEIPVHLYAYAGFPRALNALGALMAVTDQRKSRGVVDILGPESSPLPKDWDSLKQGTEVQTRLSGQPVGGPLFDFAPIANEYLRSHLFGDIFARDVLDYRSRELATVAALSSLDGVEPQLAAHMRISTNAGLTKAQLQAVTSVLNARVGEQASRRAVEALRTLGE